MPITNDWQEAAAIDAWLRANPLQGDRLAPPAVRAIDLGPAWGERRRRLLPDEPTAAMLVELLGAAMLTAREEHGTCTEHDLLRAGFLPEEIATHRDAALRRAIAHETMAELRHQRVHRVPAGRRA